MSKRVIDLSNGGNAIPHRQQPVRVDNRQLQQQQMLRMVQAPTYTTRDIGPFDNGRKTQMVQEQRPQQVVQQQRPTQVQQRPPQTPPQARPPPPSLLQQSDTRKKDGKEMVNGCDISGCSSIAEVYQKNEKTIKLVLT